VQEPGSEFDRQVTDDIIKLLAPVLEPLEAGNDQPFREWAAAVLPESLDCAPTCMASHAADADCVECREWMLAVEEVVVNLSDSDFDVLFEMVFWLGRWPVTQRAWNEFWCRRVRADRENRECARRVRERDFRYRSRGRTR
jgi:hypothetical protein